MPDGLSGAPAALPAHYSTDAGTFRAQANLFERHWGRFATAGRGTKDAFPFGMPRVSNHVVPSGWRAIARHYVGDLVYGANDGLVTTFAAVAGVEGGSLSAITVLIVGIANLAADGLSMGIGNYLSIRARESAREADGLPEDEAEPARHGVATFLAFVIVGVVPLLPYVWFREAETRRVGSVVATFVALFGVGAARGLVTARRWWRTGLEVLVLGALAGVAAFGAGALISRMLTK